MQYKDEFICEGTDAYVADMLPHKKKQSGARVGEMIAEQFGHNVLERPDGQKVYKLEFVAWPADKFNGCMQHLKAALHPNDYEIVFNTINKIDRLANTNTK